MARTDTTTDFYADLYEFLAEKPVVAVALMDKLPAEFRDFIIRKYQAGVLATDLRKFAAKKYPEHEFRQGNFDQWLYKHAARKSAPAGE